MKTSNLLKISLCVGTAFLMSNSFAHNQDVNLVLAKEDKATQEPNDKKSAKDSSYLSDAEITAKVKEKFIEEKLFGKEKISAIGIHVKTVNGVVYLKGKVSSKEQEDNAISLAKGIKGVKEVKSMIKVKEAKK